MFKCICVVNTEGNLWKSCNVITKFIIQHANVEFICVNCIEIIARLNFIVHREAVISL